MTLNNRWRTGRTCQYTLFYHLVFTPKYRHAVFNAEMLTRLGCVYQETCEQMGGELIEFNGEEDHLHLLVVCPPKVALSNFIGKLKGKSSYVMRKEFPDEVREKLWGDQFWSPSYCAVSCGGAPLEIIEKYIQNQRVPETKNELTASHKGNP